MNMEVAALLTLHIPCLHTHIRHSGSGIIVNPNAEGLERGTEYCTGQVIVAGVRFMGDYNAVKLVMREFTLGHVRIVSNFDPKFEYRPGFRITEPEFGIHGSRGIGCIKGIHFFKDEESAIKYIGRGFICVPSITPTISCMMIDDIDSENADLANIPVVAPPNPDRKHVISYRRVNSNKLRELKEFISSAVVGNRQEMRRYMTNLFGSWYEKHNPVVPFIPLVSSSALSEIPQSEIPPETQKNTDQSIADQSIAEEEEYQIEGSAPPGGPPLSVAHNGKLHHD
jgi:hypothetical protein